MKVLVACEFSGIVRDAFLARGHDVMSCDLLDTERPGPHHVGDVRPLLRRSWDLVIAHPPCTYLANSGVRWLQGNNARYRKMQDAVLFFMDCLQADAPRVAVENPVMARKWTGIRKADFSVQPWQFGDNFKKRTCFWTKNLLPLEPTSDLDGSTAVAQVHLTPPGSDRQTDRSRFYGGMAKAMADQWG